MKLVQQGFDAFKGGSFGNAGANLFVDANGKVRRISDQDLNGDGCFDIVFPNSHGYIEREHTEIYTKTAEGWKGKQLPHDSCWKTRAVDMDGDGYPDLIIANGENGVSSDLTSYLYWGGPEGLTGERLEFPTTGAYDVAAIDLTGNGLRDLVFTSAWHDHHYPGFDFNQVVYVQESPRKFREATSEFCFEENTIMSLAAGDLTGEGYDSLVLAGYRGKSTLDSRLHVYRGTKDGLLRNDTVLDTCSVTEVQLEDVFGTGRPDLITTGNNTLTIYKNHDGRFSDEDKTVITVEGARTQFLNGRLACAVADIDGDGIREIVIGTPLGFQIRKADDLQNVWQQDTGVFVSDVKAYDFGHTGKMDLVVAVYATEKSYDTDSFLIHEKDGQWKLNNAEKLLTHGAMHVEIADLDNDGTPEIIFCNTMSGPNQADPAFPVFCYYGSRDLIYKEENRVSYPVNCGAYSYVAADVDNDGYVELLLTSWDGVRVFKGTPKGPDPENFYDIIDPYSRITGGLILADLNHNGWLDLILSSYPTANGFDESGKIPSSLTVFYGGPEGYSEERAFRLPAELGAAQALVLADLNGDGYLDLASGDHEGNVCILYGNGNGLEAAVPVTVPLKNANGAELMGLTAVDVNGDGKLELIGTSCGHYTHKKSFLNILYDQENGYPPEKQLSFDTGGTTGYVTFADLRRVGAPDMIVPFYSTTETRVLPMRIFRNDGKGNFDFEHPLKIECESSIASLAVDLDRNGYPDLLVCCHRNDIGHTVQSLLFHNGPEGLDLEHPQKLWAYGPHDFTRNCILNMADRSETEMYTSSVLEIDEKPSAFRWEAECPFDTKLTFQVRSAQDRKALDNAPWRDITENGEDPKVPAEHKFLQYRAGFFAPNAIGSPKLTKVEIG